MAALHAKGKGTFASEAARPEQQGLLSWQELMEVETGSGAPRKKRRLPHGTSEYQAAWILDDLSDSEALDEDNENASTSSDALSNEEHPSSNLPGAATGTMTRSNSTLGAELADGDESDIMVIVSFTVRL